LKFNLVARVLLFLAFFKVTKHVGSVQPLNCKLVKNFGLALSNPKTSNYSMLLLLTSCYDMTLFLRFTSIHQYYYCYKSQ